MQRINQARSLPKSFHALTLAAALCLAMLPRLAAAQNIVSVEDAVRFLEQTSFGANWNEIQGLQAMSSDPRGAFAAYLQDQFDTPASGWADRGLCPDNPGAPANPCGPPNTRDFYTMYPVQVEFFTKALTAPDQLRQRVVFALDQMWVISAQLRGNFQAGWMDYYLQILENNAFGNWRQLMYEVTLSPGMGKYLDMSGNFFVANRATNENYAREILQLFNVGLDELYDSGDPMLDADGNRIPSYTQDQVVGFSKAFTGWRLQADVTDSPRDPACLPDPPSRRCPNWREPMQPVNPAANHDHTEKELLDGVVLPARLETECDGGCVVQDLNDALDNIFNNHNTPVYVCKNFIQYLVTSNPSSNYVLNCVAAFRDNGQGVRGDMKAMLTAILLDPEARTAPDPLVNPNYGKLREPVLAITNLLRNFNVNGSVCSTTGTPCTDFVLGESYIPGNLRMDEDVFRSPTVFNFFPPGFVIAGTDPPLYGPEFAILSTTSELARINMMNALIYTGIGTSTDRPYGTRIDPAELVAYFGGDDASVVAGLNQIMMHGNISPGMRDLLLQQISGVTDPAEKVKKAAYLIAISPSYSVQR